MVKISKKELKGLIGKILEARVEEEAKKVPTKPEDIKKQEENEDLEEAHCGRRNDDKELEEGDIPQGLKDYQASKKKSSSDKKDSEEGEVTNPGKHKTRMKAGYDDDGDGVPNGADKDSKDGSVKESKIQTPEQEQKLYESRFNKRNDEIFDKLKKLWTK